MPARKGNCYCSNTSYGTGWRTVSPSETSSNNSYSWRVDNNSNNNYSSCTFSNHQDGVACTQKIQGDHMNSNILFENSLKTPIDFKMKQRKLQDELKYKPPTNQCQNYCSYRSSFQPPMPTTPIKTQIMKPTQGDFDSAKYYEKIYSFLNFK